MTHWPEHMREVLVCVLAATLLVVATSVRLIPDVDAAVCGSDEDCQRQCELRKEPHCDDMMHSP